MPESKADLRLKYLLAQVELENKIRDIYKDAVKEIKRLRKDSGTKAKARLIVEDADKRAALLTFTFVRNNANKGEEDSIRGQLEEMVKRWPQKRA